MEDVKMEVDEAPAPSTSASTDKKVAIGGEKKPRFEVKKVSMVELSELGLMGVVECCSPMGVG
jgi:hypothetical protein